jgi:Protein of unknown function (DUF742)
VSSSKDRWLDRDAGPVVRLYALTQGRTRPAGESSLDLVDVVVATDLQAVDRFRPGPEHRRMLILCRRPVTVADLASEIDLPIGVARVLLGDLSLHGLIRVYRLAQRGSATDELLLRKVLDGLQAL